MRRSQRSDEVDAAVSVLIRKSFVEEDSRPVRLVIIQKWSGMKIIFLTLFKKYKCIHVYRIRVTGKKNRNKVHDAFKSIAEEMGSINIEELKKKKENLFQTYRGYRRKVFCSQKSGAGTGDIYKPIWAPYSLLDNFLHGIYTPKGKFDTDNLDANEDLNKDDEGRSDNDKDTSQMDFNENKNTEELSINDGT
nr:unnamed protein product [Callosobruchus analis]